MFWGLFWGSLIYGNYHIGFCYGISQISWSCMPCMNTVYRVPQTDIKMLLVRLGFRDLSYLLRGEAQAPVLSKSIKALHLCSGKWG